MEDIKFGLWLKEWKNGKFQWWSITVEGKKYYINVFKNARKTEEKHPDYNWFLKEIVAQPKIEPMKWDISIDDLPY